MSASESSAPGTQPERLRSVRRSPFWWLLSKWSVLLFSKIWFRLRVEHPERLPATGPVLLVANHSSYLDPPMVGITARRWIGFLAQAGLARFAPMRWWLAQVGVTLIDRHAPSKASLRLVADCLKAGEVVGLFPEGTRSLDGRVSPFRNGVEFLVRRTGATVVPIGIEGAFRAYPRGAWFPRPRKIVVRYGEPWSAEQVLAKGGVERLRRQVAELAHCGLRDDEPRDDSLGAGAPAGVVAGGGLADAAAAGGVGRPASQSGCAPDRATVDPTNSRRSSGLCDGSSTSASAGGGA